MSKDHNFQTKVMEVDLPVNKLPPLLSAIEVQSKFTGVTFTIELNMPNIWEADDSTQVADGAIEMLCEYNNLKRRLETVSDTEVKLEIVRKGM